MGMLHPRFNHLGRSKKRTGNKPKSLIAAEEEHAKFLKKHGINPNVKRRRLKGAIPLNDASR